MCARTGLLPQKSKLELAQGPGGFGASNDLGRTTTRVLRAVQPGFNAVYSFPGFVWKGSTLSTLESVITSHSSKKPHPVAAMSFLKLPNEILQQVISLVGPETFEDAALACKQIYHASSPFWKEHNALRKRFRHFQYSGRRGSSERPVASQQDAAEPEILDENENVNKGRGDGRANERKDDIKIHSVLELLQYIARHPVVARYMVYVDLSHDFLGEHTYDVQDAEKPLIKGDTSGILRLLQDSPYLNKRGYDASTWLEAMQQTADGHADIFLLTLLPNVEELVVSGRMADASYSDRNVNESEDEREGGGDETAASPILQCRSILEDIVDEANKYPQSNASLSRLRVVGNDGTDDDTYEDKHNFTAVSSLLAIGSVCKFHGASFVAMEDGYTGVEFHPRYKRLSPNLEEIVLEHSILGAMSASKLFSRIENLRVFRLSWTVKYHGCGFNWDTGAMLHSLEQAAGDTLEVLSIHDTGSTNMTGAVPVTMKGFKRLRVFEADFDFLREEPFDRAQQPEELEDDTEPGNYHREVEGTPPEKVAPFVDFLPGTIERIFFSVGSLRSIAEDDMSFLFDRMHEERATKLPQLKDISFVMPNPTPVQLTGYQPISASELPGVSEQTEARDRLVALITSCGGTVETEEWWQPGKGWMSA